VKSFQAGVVRSAALVCAALFLLAASAGPALAQRGGPGATAAGRRTDTLNRQGEQYERDRLSRESKGTANATANAKEDRRRAQEIAEQVRHDFEGLQAAYNNIVLAMSPKGSHDPDSILDSVDEVKKCAARLRTNLALPRAKDEEHKAQTEAAAPQTEESLLLLRKHIYSFVTNPLFEAAPVLNVEQAGKAARDLEMILELSESIRRGGRPKGHQD
jgi:hypothetical protein